MSNRRHFEHRWALSWERGRRSGQALALLVMDVPYASGNEPDARLLVLADTLRGLATEPDCCGARHGGQRLLLLTTPADAQRVAAGLRTWSERMPTATGAPAWHVRTQIVRPAADQDPRAVLAARAASTCERVRG